MKIAFPTTENRSLESGIYGHFGSAPLFIIVDTDNRKAMAVSNSDRDHLHGQCQPLKALGGNLADAVVVNGIGSGALRKLQQAGIKVYRAVDGTVGDNLKLIEDDRLPEFSQEQTCTEHGIHGECIH